MHFRLLFVSYWIVTSLLAFSSTTLANQKNSEVDCSKSNLWIVQNTSTADYTFKLDETLVLEVTGQYFNMVEEVRDEQNGNNVFILYLDDVPMVGLPTSLTQKECTKGKGGRISFHLKRDSNDDQNHQAWNTLLEKQHDGYLMSMPVSLGIGNKLPIQVTHSSRFKLYIVTKTKAYTTLIICLILFVSLFRFLLKSSTALRETLNGRYSLGKSQMAFWGLFLALAFSAIWCCIGTIERVPEQLLILLGISGATGLSSILIGKKKANIQSRGNIDGAILQKEYDSLKQLKESSPDSFTENNQIRLEELAILFTSLAMTFPGQASRGFWADISSDDKGLSFYRLQVIIWTIILGIIFIESVMQTASMPVFPENLLTLMGISNGIYLGFKFPENTA